MFSQTAEYALRAVVFLAESGETRYTTQAIAETTRIPPRYLAKVLQNLARAGVLVAQRGVYGGFILSRSSTEISVYDVIQAVDPLKRIYKCPLNLEAHKDQLCPLHARLDASVAMIEEDLRGVSIANLLQRPTFRKVG
jgi:Rrf2 family transcriptional regulator, nitric oxide-sensitive transcriptional repressor